MTQALLSLLLTVAPEPVVLDVLIAGKQVGSAHYSQSLLPDGGKLVQVMLELVDQKRKIFVRTRSEYTKLGEPVRMFQAKSVSGLSERRQTTVEFSSSGARAGRSRQGAMAFQDVPLDPSLPRKNASLFWIIRDMPKSGTELKSYEFNLESLSWDLVTTRYVGKETLPLGQRSVVAHRVDSERGEQTVTTYLDDAGDPLYILMGETQMIRHTKQASQ